MLILFFMLINLILLVMLIIYIIDNADNVDINSNADNADLICFTVMSCIIFGELNVHANVSYYCRFSYSLEYKNCVGYAKNCQALFCK